MASAQVEDARGGWAVERKVLPPELEWVDDAALWSNLMGGRFASQNGRLARLFVTFIRALVAVIVSH